MAENTGISWAGRTHQFTAGCLVKSRGCAHCYAETMALACFDGHGGNKTLCQTCADELLASEGEKPHA